MFSVWKKEKWKSKFFLFFFFLNLRVNFVSCFFNVLIEFIEYLNISAEKLSLTIFIFLKYVIPTKLSMNGKKFPKNSPFYSLLLNLDYFFSYSLYIKILIRNFIFNSNIRLKLYNGQNFYGIFSYLYHIYFYLFALILLFSY